MHTKIRVESQLIEEVREVAVANGVRSATALVNWLIAAGLDDLRSGRLRVQRGMMLERVEPPSQSEPRNAGRRQRSRAASKRTVSPQGFPATNPVHSDPHQSETTEARRSRGHQSTQLRSAPVGSQPTSNPAHSDPQQSGAHSAEGTRGSTPGEPTDHGALSKVYANQFAGRSHGGRTPVSFASRHRPQSRNGKTDGAARPAHWYRRIHVDPPTRERHWRRSGNQR